MKEREIIKKFLEELEQKVLACEERIKLLETDIHDYKYIQDLQEVLTHSKIAFAEGVVTLKEDKKEEFMAVIRKIVREQSLLDKILSETSNLYFLNEAGLMNQNEVAPQRDEANHILEILNQKLEIYKNQLEDDYNKKQLNQTKKFIEKIIELATKFNDDGLEDSIEDIDFLGKILEDINLNDEEKFALLTHVLTRNINYYNMSLRKKENQTDLKEMPIEDDLEDFLRKPEIISRIVSTIDSSITDYKKIDKELLNEMIHIAKEEILKEKNDKKLTTEEAYRAFINKHDEQKAKNIEKLKLLFKDQSLKQVLDDSKANQVIKEAKEFTKRFQKAITKLSSSEKELLENYIIGLYKEKNLRIPIYKSKMYSDDRNEIMRDAAYEIQYFLTLSESLDRNNEEEHKLWLTACQRIQDVFDCLSIVMNDTEKDFIKETPSENEGNIFFLMKNPEKSFFEEDMKFERGSKGISKSFYKEIEDNMEQLKNIPTKTNFNSIKGSWKNLRSMGVRYKEGFRTSIFYIPYNQRDIIIIGAGFINGKDTSFKNQDYRVKNYENRISELMEKLNNESTRQEEIEKSKKIRERIQKITKNNHPELDDMLDKRSEEDSESINPIHR